MKETLLRLEHASVKYGGVHALEDVSLSIDEGEIIALLGPNGAGKSTILKALFGSVPLARGHVLWREKIVVPKTFEMAARGVMYVPQGRQIFQSLTVRENLELGGYALANQNDLGNAIEEVLRFFPGLTEKLNRQAGVLSGGQQQMLAIARALVGDPKILFLDEPSLGLSPKIVREVFEKVAEINRLRGIAVVIVEHSIASVLAIASRAYVLSGGRIIAEQPADDLLAGDTLERIFLGSAV
jgi:ABC-type branched-subunit amino acid transport system ATPase component